MRKLPRASALLLILALAFLPLRSLAGGSLVGFAGVQIDSSEVTVTNVSTTLAAANAGYTYMLIQNKGATNMYLNFGAAAVAGSGVIVGAGGNYEMLRGSTVAVNAITSAGTTAVTILRGR